MQSNRKPILLTVVMPAKGDCEGLNESAKSILHQSECVEWIIIRPRNHEVTDAALAILPSDPRIRIIDEEFSGIYPSMNQGLRLAEGKYVVFFGVGDYFLASNAVSHMTSKLEFENKQWGLGSWFFLNKDNSVISPPIDSKIFKHDVFLVTTPLCHQTVIATKKILKRTGGFDTNLVVAADRLSIRKLWDESEPAVWDFPTIAYKTGGFSSVNQTLAIEELNSLHAFWGDKRNLDFSSWIKRRLIANPFHFANRKSNLLSEFGGNGMIMFDWLPTNVKRLLSTDEEL
jgi:hypothetical protein